MEAFFADVGSGPNAGVWSEEPKDRPAFREQYARRMQKLAQARKAEEMV
jgi:3,8-divinyl chlorophyllide a/chlorophyllide a reductase subunit Y